MKHNATIIFIHGLVGLLVALRPFTFFYKRENPCGLTPFFYKRENPCGYAALRPFTSFYKRERILASWFERTSFRKEKGRSPFPSLVQRPYIIKNFVAAIEPASLVVFARFIRSSIFEHDYVILVAFVLFSDLQPKFELVFSTGCGNGDIEANAHFTSSNL